MQFARRLTFAIVAIFGPTTFTNAAEPLVRIADVVGGHIHPSLCISKRGVLVATYGRVNHRDLRITRSTDGGKSWTAPEPFVHTVGKSYYPGSLAALADGRIVHCWNRWSEPTNEQEPRSVLYSISSDDGVTWSEPQAMPRSTETRSVIRHPIIELAANRWLTSIDDRTIVLNPTTGEGAPLGDGRNHGLVPIVRTPTGTFVSGAGLRSTDEGKSWQPTDQFPDIKSQGWRHELTCLSDGTLLASEVIGPGVGGERWRWVISTDDGVTWNRAYEFYNPGRAIGGRACPRTVELGPDAIGTVFYDVDPTQPHGPSLYFLRTSRKDLASASGR